MRNVQILPFNLKDAEKTGKFAKIIFGQNKINVKKLSPRAIIPNDSKLFAQADLDNTISSFVTSDARSINTLTLLKTSGYFGSICATDFGLLVPGISV